MTFISRTNDWLSAILKVVALIVIVISISWFGLSVYSNIAEAQAKPPDLPNVSKAAYEFDMISGQVFLVREYSTVSEGNYLLKGYYYFTNNKWVYSKGTLPLDEKYWGPITIKRRQVDG